MKAGEGDGEITCNAERLFHHFYSFSTAIHSAPFQTRANERVGMELQILRRRDVENLVGLRRSAIYLMIQRGEFPKPIKLGNGPTGAVGWVKSEIEAWLSDRITARDEQKGS